MTCLMWMWTPPTTAKLKVSTLTPLSLFHMKFNVLAEIQNNVKHTAAVIFPLYVWLGRAKNLSKHNACVLYCLVCAVGQTRTRFPKTGDEHRSRGVTSVHPVVIDVKSGIKLCFRANLSMPFHYTACHAACSVFIETPPKQSGMAGTDGSSNPGKLSLNLSE